MLKRMEAVAFGALGGMCPTIAKLAGSYSSNPLQDVPALGVFIGLALFAFLGGVIALGFGSNEVKAAIVAGIAAPAIVTNVISGAQEKDPGAELALLNFVPAAYAEGPVLGTPITRFAGQPQGFVTVRPTVVGGSPLQVGTLNYAWMRNGVVIADSAGELRASYAQSLAVPFGATELTVAGQTISVQDVLSEGGVVDVTVFAKATFGGDLRWALGGQRQLQVGGVALEATAAQ